MASRDVRVPLHDLPGFAIMLRDGMIALMKDKKVEITRNGPEDLDQRILYCSAEKPVLTSILPVTIGFELPPPELLHLTLSLARQQEGVPALICVAAEAYMRELQEDEASQFWDEPYERGQFKNDPKAVECLSISVVYRTPEGGLHTMYTVVPFRYADGTVVFSEPRHIDEEGGEDIGGQMIAVIKAAFAVEAN